MEESTEVTIKKEFITEEPSCSAVPEVEDHNYFAVKQEVIKLEEPEIEIKVEAVDIELDPLDLDLNAPEHHINTVISHEQDQTSNTLHKCTQCKYTTNNRHKFKSHTWQHMPYVGCTFCDFTTKSTKKLQDHLQTFHSDEKIFKCIAEVYRARDRYIYTIPKHILAHYPGRKPFKCDYCDYKTARESDLQKHMKVHDPNALKCTHCDYRTALKRTMTSHLKIHGILR